MDTLKSYLRQINQCLYSENKFLILAFVWFFKFLSRKEKQNTDNLMLAPSVGKMQHHKKLTKLT